MRPTTHILWWRCPLILGLFSLLATTARAQEGIPCTPAPTQEPLLPRLEDISAWAPTDADSQTASHPSHIRLFHMATGYLSEPIGADSDPDPTPADAAPAGPADPDLPIVASLWNDNPYFDLRRPGDPGGTGYYHIYTQLQLFETGKTGCSLGCEALTPAGLEADGLQSGPTVLRPNFALYRELDDGGGFQGFIGKGARLGERLDGHPDRSLEYGLALHHPLPNLLAQPVTSLHVFVEALGRYRVDGEDRTLPPAVWEVVPGLHWRLSDDCWLSGGVLLPLNSQQRFDVNAWQVTCQWHF